MRSALIEGGKVTNIILGTLPGYVEVDDTVGIGWSYANGKFTPPIVPDPGPQPPAAYRISKADIFRRATEDEADKLRALLSQVSVRMQEIYYGAPYVSTGDELYQTLHDAIEAELGSARANELLAPSEGI